MKRARMIGAGILGASFLAGGLYVVSAAAIPDKPVVSRCGPGMAYVDLLVDGQTQAHENWSMKPSVQTSYDLHIRGCVELPR